MLIAALGRRAVAENDAVHVLVTLRIHAHHSRRATGRIYHFITCDNIAHQLPASRRQNRRVRRHRFPKPHVVGQQGAQVVALEGGKPGYAALLVTAQGAFEAFGLGGHFDAGALADVFQQAFDPAAGFDGGDLHAVQRRWGERRRQRFGQRHLAALVLLNERQRPLDLVRAHVDPPSAQLH